MNIRVNLSIVMYRRLPCGHSLVKLLPPLTNFTIPLESEQPHEQH